MRRLLVALSVLLILPLSASAWMSPIVCSGGGQSASCADTASGNYGETFEDGLNLNLAQYSIRLLSIDLGAADGSNPTIHTYVADNGSNGEIKFVIYDDDGGSGEPGTLLYASSSATGVTSSSYSWKSEASSTGCLTGVVWVGFISGNAMAYGLNYKTSGGVTRSITNENFTPPETWDSGGDSHATSAYAIYLSW